MTTLLQPPSIRSNDCWPASRRSIWRDHLAFRDRLRAAPELAAAYARLKQDLMERFPTDRLAYTAGKDAFIASLHAIPADHNYADGDPASTTP